ncbi:MAG: class I SAM-dependent rRNA methyltransferase [Candidatus Sumerlaeaceae bacterium]
MQKARANLPLQKARANLPFRKPPATLAPATAKITHDRPQFQKPLLSKHPEKPSGSPDRRTTGIPTVHSSGLPTIVVTLKDTRSQKVRHTWYYDNMVAKEPANAAEADGNAVAVMEQPGKFLGSAIYNSHSRIRARIFSLDATRFNEAYIKGALEAAIARRHRLFAREDSCRLVFGDSDGLPGLIVDKIGTVLVIQLLTLAADRHATFIVDQLQRSIAPRGIVIRRDLNIREKEGLPILEPELIGEVPTPIEVQQDGFTVYADLLAGQKTGLFLDQRFNRQLIKPWCKDAQVLDLFCYVGAWSFTAALGGARKVIGVDSSAAAIALAERAAATNGFSNVRFETSDVFEYLDKITSDTHNVIVCDPPAFAKTRTHVHDALKAYLSLNYRCMKNLAVGGILATSSCSQHVGADEFETMLETAARNARMQFQIVARSSQSPDHPALLGFPESEYLKCFVLQRIE